MGNFDQVALLLVVLVPLAGAGLTMFMPGDRPKDSWYFALFVGAISLVLSVVVFARYDYQSGGFQFERVYEWLPGPMDINLALGIDGISAPLIVLNGIVLMGGVMISQNITYRTREFFVLLLALAAGVYGVFVVRDLFFLFFFYELAVLPMYLLIGVWGSSTRFSDFLRTKEYGAMKLILFLVAGSILIWVGILAIYAQAASFGEGTFSLEKLGEFAAAGRFDTNFQMLVFPLFMVGFGSLAGLWPFHTWSPDGHVAAPTAVSMLHAGVLMKLGAYGIIQGGHLPAAGGGGLLVDDCADWLGDGQRPVRRNVGHVATGPQIHHRLFQRQPHGLRADGNRHPGPDRHGRRGPADVLPRDHDGPHVHAGRRDLRPDPHP